jgi:hypothetical protein
MSDRQALDVNAEFDLNAEDVSQDTWQSLVDEIKSCTAFDSCGGGGSCSFGCTIGQECS